MYYSSDNVSAWERRRSLLNHYKLKNIFENSALAFHALCRDQVSRRALEEKMADLQSAWNMLRPEIESLLMAYRSEAGPRRLFAALPLVRLAPEHLEWLQALTVEMWWNRVDGDGLKRAAGKRIAEVSQAFESVAALVSRFEPPSPGLSEELVAAASELCSKIHALGNALTAFKRRSYVDT